MEAGWSTMTRTVSNFAVNSAKALTELSPLQNPLPE
ncbi:hypothetical protein a10_02453 [Streptomyces acidiscabies]|nr:hypothetical protein a10_02453 [Streptomyces acidiscabies]GAV39863.1 hypothetical protein Saa2_02750 [Streptomyces acidiscabies]